MRNAVRNYYDGFGEREWERLTRQDDGAVEFAVTQRAIERYLPAGAPALGSWASAGDPAVTVSGWPSADTASP